MIIAKILGLEGPQDQAYNRQKVGNRTALIGLATNLILFAVKLFAGLLTHSIAVIGDALNNLTDAGSSVLTLVSFTLSSKPPDKNHPFGHARLEYVFSSLAAFLIFFVGIQLGMESWQKIRQPEDILFSPLALGLLVFSILAKIGLYFFYRTVGHRIHSDLLQAQAIDSLADCLSSGVIVLSLIVSSFLGWKIDGWMGLLVAAIILKAGYDIFMESINKLLGSPAEPDQIRQIEDFVLSYPGIHGFHDLIIHDYGPGRKLASIHAEVDVRQDLLSTHILIDQIELEAQKTLGVSLLIHTDPIDPTDPRLNPLAHHLTTWFDRSGYGGLTFHDLRIIESYDHNNVVFSIEIPASHSLDLSAFEKDLQEGLTSLNPRYRAIISYITPGQDSAYS